MNLNNFIYETELKNFHDAIKNLTQDFIREDENSNTLLTPRADVIESESDFRLMVELPGIKKEEITIKFENGNLTISGEKKFYADEKIKVKLNERLFGQFKRNFKLGEKVDTNSISAEFTNGVLAISIAKKQPQKFEKTIDIK